MNDTEAGSEAAFLRLIAADTPMEHLVIDGASIVSGNPRASTTVLYSSPDGNLTVGIFACTPGAFRFQLETDEITHLLAGHVVIELDDGRAIDARAGDTYILSAGASMLVDVREEIRDVYTSWTIPSS